MLLPPNRSIRITRLEPTEGDPSEQRSSWTSTFMSRDWSVGAEIFKKNAESSVLRCMVHSRDIVLKTRRSTGIKGMIEGITRSGRSHRQWQGSDWLRSIGVSSPNCIAIARGTRDGVAVETLVTEHVPGHTLLWQVARGLIHEDPESPASRAVAYAVGRDIAQIIKSGRFNRDHKPSNLVVTHAAPPIAKITTVDAVAILPVKLKDRVNAMARMIASLLIEPIGIGHPMPPTFMRRVVESLGHEIVDPPNVEPWTRELIAQAERLVEEHGDPTPEHDPLIGTH